MSLDLWLFIGANAAKPKGVLKMQNDKMPARFDDWRVRLHGYLTTIAGLGFKPGQSDCALFAAGAFEAQTGVDLAAEWRGSYRSMRAGRALLLDRGFVDHVALAASFLPDVAPSFANVGDIGVIAGDGGPALCVVQGAGVYCLRPDGLAVVSRLELMRAFKV